MIFIDSNMWCYYFDQRLPEHGYVREPLREIIKTGEIACNTIIVMEVAHYLVRHLQAKDARRKIEYFVNLENMKIVDFDRQIMMEALESLVEHAHTHGLGGRDATVIATLKKLGVNKVLSHDNIFKRLAAKLEIEVIDPIPVKP
ncbi:MAG: type II toxin-antitoxin system VapC family toxin [Thermoproteota archaeon]|nr:type II toxin-antitoxin system VapC family toxin [Candidatus Brockarchaeota archaeon]